jgi:hypothetical protein
MKYSSGRLKYAHLDLNFIHFILISRVMALAYVEMDTPKYSFLHPH